ncbi:MAG: short-subunit dehydrogenase [Myxococcota bacterium]|jgi:short-subunit dehydrogenase
MLEPGEVSVSREEVVLVTGASIGLGLAIAQALMTTPRRLILTARVSSMKRFAEAGVVESDRIWLRPLDVTNAEQRVAIIEEAAEKWGGIDVLINNAGISYRSVVEHVQEEERLAQMGINFRAPMELTRLVLPGMRARRYGRIINISSVGGMMAMPTMAVYSASKFALEGASESMWYEVRPWGISVTLVEPGFIRSSSFEKVRLTEMSAASRSDDADPYHTHYARMEPFIARMMSLSLVTPKRIARRVLRLMDHPDPPLRAGVTPDAMVFDLLRRFLPRRLYHWILYRSLPKIRTWGAPALTKRD